MLRHLRRIQLARETNAHYGAGSFTHGNILIIGEQASDPATAPEQLPFCDDRGCSGWLNSLLEDNNIPEEKLFWVNAKNNDGSTIHLKELVEVLAPSMVFALGKTAEKLCIAEGVNFKSFQHPQYHKRFKNKQTYDLISQLKEVCTC
jgi:hypothetical protein